MTYLLFVCLAFLTMELAAWFTHKYIMHGVLWTLHQDHHQKENAKQFFEKNDFFFLIFAIPGFLCLLIGAYNDYNFIFWIGLGITLYGLCYFLIHDIFIHQRFKILRNTNSAYLKAIRRAHKVHHKHLGKKDGECFGMLWVPTSFYKDAKQAKD
ncbi:MAG: sterol desaturase family protein [Phycisphaerales bacterium]|nr:sterol desaturase family protein [Phycisphaerales bacterium]